MLVSLIKVLYHGRGVFHKIIPVVVEYIVQNGDIDLKMSKIIHIPEIFLPDSDDPLLDNLKIDAFYINQKVNFLGNFWGIFLI